jgi:hypothetical protein
MQCSTHWGRKQSRVGSIPAAYSESVGFRCQSGDRLLLTEIFLGLCESLRCIF